MRNIQLCPQNRRSKIPPALVIARHESLICNDVPVSKQSDDDQRCRMTQSELDSTSIKAADILRGNADHSEFRGYVFALLFDEKIQYKTT